MSELTLDKLPRKVLARLDLETVFAASRSVIAAEKLAVFRHLRGRELSAAEVGRRTGIHPDQCESFLDFLVFLGLLKKRNKRYRNSRLTERHFLRPRSSVFTGMWSEYCAKDFEAFTVIEDVLLSGKDWRLVRGQDRKSDYERLQEDPEWARDFTYALYDINKSDAEALAKNLDLTGYHAVLDVGGGSGVMSAALLRANPRLKACVLDFQFVCDTTKEIIRKKHLSRRLTTRVGDMNKAIPKGYDVIMFLDIGHIDTKVMKMAFDSLAGGGMIVRDCVPQPRSKSPSPGAFVRKYLSVMPEGQSKAGIVESLKEVGFRSVKYRIIHKGLGLITALK